MGDSKTLQSRRLFFEMLPPRLPVGTSTLPGIELQLDPCASEIWKMKSCGKLTMIGLSSRSPESICIALREGVTQGQRLV